MSWCSSTAVTGASATMLRTGPPAAGAWRRRSSPWKLDCEILLNTGHRRLLAVHTARPGTESYERLKPLRVVGLGLQDLSPTPAG
ncbi:hypothetical protein [Streptomyces sp. NPDC051636]|uniref:hypothetical protein n=1 Tax=Streptomyces sp. NPDC051636 TaxID=3365663 RepID=UPI0037B2B1CC